MHPQGRGKYKTKRKLYRFLTVMGITVLIGEVLYVWRDVRLQSHVISHAKTSKVPSNGTHVQESHKVQRTEALPTVALIDVPPQSQFPQLPTGCEVTSLSMLFTAIGHPVDKMILARKEPTDPTKRVSGPKGSIVYWGNPNVGFVGDVYSQFNGYGIFHGPIVTLINEILPGRAEDLTGLPFTDILSVVAHGTPVMVWTTATFKPTSMWETWNSKEGIVRATMEEHAVLLVGYDQTQLFVNDPLNGTKAVPVNRQQFIAAWEQLGKQAVTIKKNT